MWGTCSNCKYGRKEKYGICCSNMLSKYFQTLCTFNHKCELQDNE